MKEKNDTTKLHVSTIFEGVNMKKIICTCALVLALVFSFTAVAGAKYAGYFRDGAAITGPAGTPANVNAGKAPGYLSWGSVTARSVIINGQAINLNANSGAMGMMNAAGVDASLMNSPHGGYTTGTTKCAVCHSVHRAYAGDGAGDGVLHGQYRLAQRNSCEQCHTTYGTGAATKLVEWAATGAGPHGSSNCTQYCHMGGIHGIGTSKYWGMNAYLLGNGTNARVTSYSDVMIADEVENGPNRPFTAANLNWFLASSGTTSVDSGSRPTGVGGTANITEFAFSKSTATGYTCARGGCHTNSALTVNRWGVSLERDAGNPNGMATGHRTAPAPGDHTSSNCFPCHPGTSLVGFTTATNPAGSGAASRANNALVDMGRNYGCDQCHDMVGVATGTTAWPHANRAIDVYEWDATGTRTTKAQGSGNLWMYSGSTIAFNTGNPVYASTVNKAWKVIDGAVGSDTRVGTINDGVCLKCHLPVDKLSQDALSAGTPRAGTYSFNSSTGVATLAVGIYHANAGSTQNIRTLNSGFGDIVADTGQTNGMRTRVMIFR